MARAERTAFISGSGQNIGRACALTLARDGFNVVVNGSRDRAACEAVADGVRAKGVEALVLMGDVGSREDTARITAEALGAFGSIDVLMNNAAIRPHAAFFDVDEAAWQRVFDVDCNAAYRFAHAFLPGMVDKGWGRVVNVAGLNALAGTLGRPHVTAAKHAVWGLTKALANEFGPKGVTANLISPGTIVGEAPNPTQLAQAERMKAQIPVGRLGTPGDIAAMVSLLVSDAGGFLNGQTFQINGGVVG